MAKIFYFVFICGGAAAAGDPFLSWVASQIENIENPRHELRDGRFFAQILFFIFCSFVQENFDQRGAIQASILS